MGRGAVASTGVDKRASEMAVICDEWTGVIHNEANHKSAGGVIIDTPETAANGGDQGGLSVSATGSTASSWTADG